MSKSPSLRRIQADVRELALDPSDRYYAAPLENDMFEWHFTIRGAEETEFEGGTYHGRILLPPEYPFKPPHIVFLTPSGRFETNTKVCLSFSAFHPELWQPAWGIRLILEALISFLPTPADGAIGALDWSAEERKRLAKQSQDYCCATCGKCSLLLPNLSSSSSQGETSKKSSSSVRFAKEIAELQRLQQTAEKKRPTQSVAAKEKSSAEVESKDSSTTPPASSSSSSSPSLPATSQNEEVRPPSSISQDAPEEEIIFGESTRDCNVKIEATPEESVEEKNNTQNDLTPSEADAEADTVPNMGVTNDAAVAAATATAVVDTVPDDPSWMFDPLLNLMLLLMAVICYLLIQKYNELMTELTMLRQMSSDL